jgi:hypothetical protein
MTVMMPTMEELRVMGMAMVSRVARMRWGLSGRSRTSTRSRIRVWIKSKII